MQAIIAHGAGDLRVDTIADAAAPGEGEIQVNINKGGICDSDLQHGSFRFDEEFALAASMID